MESFDINQLDALGVHIEKWVKERLHRGVLSAAARYVSHIKEVIDATDPKPVDMGIYRAGWQFAKTDQGSDVYNPVPHAPIVEDGARAENIKIGRKMIDALAGWVLRHGLVGRVAVSASGKRTTRSAADRTQEARQIAWAIAKAMQQRGIFNRGKGLGIERRARAKLPDILQEEIAREMVR